MAIGPKEVKRLVFREVLPGDRLKFAAKSNKTKTGGGARDFRYSPYDKFDNVFARILAGRKMETRSREGKYVDVEVYHDKATLCTPKGDFPGKSLEFEPPTTARGGEGRLTRLSSLGLSVPTGDGRVYLLIWQTGDDKVWFAFATQEQLEKGEWFESINDFLLTCMHAKRPVTQAAQGFIDFEQGSSYCKSSK